MHRKTIEKPEVISLLKSGTIIDNIDTWNQHKIIQIKKSTSINYVLIIHPDQKSIFDFVINDPHCKLDLKILFLSTESSKISSKVTLGISSSYTQAKVHSIALLSDYSQLDFDAKITIHPWVEHVQAHLLEENIFLGKDIKLKTLPLLDVHSDNVNASHGAKIHKLDDEKLFYLQSKGLGLDTATGLFINWYLNTIFKNIEDSDEKKEMIQHLYTQNYSHA